MPDQESDIQRLEDEFPAISGAAFSAARQRALESGCSVLQSEDGFIYEVFPSGERKRVKQIERPTRIPSGTKIALP